MIKKIFIHILYALIAISLYSGFGLEEISFSINWGNPGFEVVEYTAIGKGIKIFTTFILIIILVLPIIKKWMSDKNNGQKIKIFHIVISYVIAFLLFVLLYFAFNPVAWLAQQLFLFLNEHVVEMQYWSMNI